MKIVRSFVRKPSPCPWIPTEKGIDYLQTFAATPYAAPVLLLVATAVKEGLPLSPFDSIQAFVRSDNYAILIRGSFLYVALCHRRLQYSTEQCTA